MVRIRLANVLATIIMHNLDNRCRGVCPGKDLEQGCQRPVRGIDLLLRSPTAATTMSQSSRPMDTCVCRREKNRRTRVIKDKIMDTMATAFNWGPSLASRSTPGYTGVVNDMFVFEATRLTLDLEARDAPHYNHLFCIHFPHPL